MYTFKLPDLGEGIHEAELLKWHVQPGDQVKEGDDLIDVETDKAAVTISSPVSGKIASLAAEKGATLRVGQVIVIIDEGQEETPAPAAPSAISATGPDLPRQPGAAPPAPGGNRPVPAAPATRRLARELGVTLEDVTPSGPGGRVTADDVRTHAAQGTTASAVSPSREEATVPVCPATPARRSSSASDIPYLDLDPLPDFSVFGPVSVEPLRSLRRRVAHKMVTSKILIPHVAHMDEADVTRLEEFRKSENETRKGENGAHLTLLPFVVKAVTAGLRVTRAFNASLDPFKEEIIFKEFYNLGIAVDTGHGLVVPVVQNTDRKSIKQIATEIHELAVKAREGKLERADLRGGTFTITNIGPLGGTALIPAINYPEVAILGMGRVQEKPVVRDGQIVIRKMLPLTLAFDHRIADGADAARFVSELIVHLSDPNKLLLET